MVWIFASVCVICLTLICIKYPQALTFLPLILVLGFFLLS